MSHLNQRILGLDVNVTEERTVEAGDSLQHYLSYSAFSTSRSSCLRSVVALFRVRASYWAIEALLTARPAARTRSKNQLWTEYLALRDELQAEFTRYQMTAEDLKALGEDVAQLDGRWLGFAAIISDKARNLLPTYGLQAYATFSSAGAGRRQPRTGSDDLAHPANAPSRR